MRVKLWPQRQQGGDAAGHVGEMGGLVGQQSAAQQALLAVAQPFLEHLVAAQERPRRRFPRSS